MTIEKFSKYLSDLLIKHPEIKNSEIYYITNVSAKKYVEDEIEEDNGILVFFDKSEIIELSRIEELRITNDTEN